MKTSLTVFGPTVVWVCAVKHMHVLIALLRLGPGHLHDWAYLVPASYCKAF